jgi:hypothetical protein
MVDEHHQHGNHEHDHSQGSGQHVHAPKDFGVAIGTALNLGFVIVEVVYGLSANSREHCRIEPDGNEHGLWQNLDGTPCQLVAMSTWDTRLPLGAPRSRLRRWLLFRQGSEQPSKGLNQWLEI